MKQFLRKTRKLIVSALVCVVLALAVVSSLGRYYMPYVGDYRNQILALVNKQLPFTVTAEDMEGSWRRLTPRLKLDGLQLGPEQDGVSARHIAVGLSLFHSLRFQKWVFEELSIEGTELEFVESEDGSWALRADWLPQTDGEPPFSLESSFEGLKKLDVKELTLSIQPREADRIVIDHLQLQYRKQGSRWHIESNALPDESPLPVNLTIEGNGLPQHADFEAHAYALLKAFDATPYTQALQYLGWRASPAEVDGELWLDYEPGAKLETQGKLHIRELTFTHSGDKQNIEIPEMRSQFKLLLPKGEQPSVWLRDLSIKLGSESIAFARANVLPYEQGLRASFDKIDVFPVLGLIRRFEILPEQAQQVLRTMEPEGRLSNITLTLPEEDTLRKFELLTYVDKLNLRPWKGVPGVRGASAIVRMGQKGGVARLSSRDLYLRFPGVYDHPLEFLSASGTVGWQILPDTVIVESGRLDVSSPAGTALGYFDLDIPLDKSQGATNSMNLNIVLRDGKAQYKNQFVPSNLDAGLKSWLDKSILAGTVTEGAYTYRGSLKRKAGKLRTSQLFLDVRDGELKYDDNWPAAKNLRATLLLDDADLNVEVESARVAALALSQGEVQFRRTPGQKYGTVRVAADVAGSLKNSLDFIQGSPIGERLGDDLDSWDERQGSVTAKFGLELPIKPQARAVVDVRARVRNGVFGNENLDLRFADLNGPVNFSSDAGLTSTGIVGTLWNEAVTAEISSRKIYKSGASTANWLSDIAFDGQTEADALLNWLGLPLNELLAGRIEYSADLSLGSEKPSLAVRSSLIGLSSTLPHPLTKGAADSSDVMVQLYLNQKPLRLRVEVGEELAAAINLPENRPPSGMLVFGGGEVPRYLDDSVRIAGRVKQFELQQYLDLFRHFREAQPNASYELPVYAQDLVLENASVFGVDFKNVDAAIASHEDSWTFAFEGEEVAGRVLYDSSKAIALDIALDRLYIEREQPPAAEVTNENEEGTRDESENDFLKNVYPSEFPPMRAKLADLRLNGDELGRWEFTLDNIDHGAKFSNINALSRGMQISGSPSVPAQLSWQRVGDQQQTHFQGMLACSNIADVLNAWKVEPAINSKSCQFDTDISWYGSPLAVSTEGLEGRVDIQFSNGQFMEANSTANAMRIFSLFNFDTIFRRLTLNFDDVFKRGMSYDQVTGKFEMANGKLQIVEAFDVKGPSSRFQMLGELDLENEKIDTQLIATLPLSSNLPWVAALAGGIPAAAGVYVAGKIFPKPFERLSSASYTVSGSWEDPKIELQRIFDDELSEEPEQSVPTAERAAEEAIVPDVRDEE